jgi:hypothetical protein
MLSKKLPPTGHSFKMSGSSGFARKFSSMVNHGQFSSLKNNKDLAIKIFKKLTKTIKDDGKIPFFKRSRALREFDKNPNTSDQDTKNFKKILENYK